MTDTFTVRTLPKISVDPGIEILDSHSRTPQEARQPLCSSKAIISLGLAAADKIVQDLGEAVNYVEAIKIFFYWNVNKSSFQRFCASAVLVEPVTNNKIRVEAHTRIWLEGRKKNERMKAEDAADIAALSTNLQQALRWQIKSLQTKRKKLASTLSKFDDLLADVPPREMPAKEYCDSLD